MLSRWKEIRSKVTWGLVFAVIAAGSPAEVSPQVLSAKPPQLFAVVRALEARYHGVTALKATFLERRSEGKRTVEIESGTVYFRKPGRMRWEYEIPEKKLFLTDGKYAWFYVPADHTVSRTTMKESDDERVPLALLTGNAKLSRVCKRIEFAGASTLSGNSPSAINHIALKCFPRSEGAFLDAIIELDAGYRIARILLHEPGAIETEFRFADWQENARLSDGMFRFAAPPGVAIVEAPSAESLNQ